MKRLILCLYALAIAFCSWATGQQGDVIFIDGERWNLLGEPIEADSVLSHQLRDRLPQKRDICSDNWKGYTAYWSIRHECVYLDSIKVSINQHLQPLPDSVMHKVFQDYYCKTQCDGFCDEGIMAQWLTRNIRVGKGNKIHYEHMGYVRNLEHEQIITIDAGRVTDVKTYHNRVAIEGFSFNRLHTFEDAKECIAFPVEKYPELAGKKVPFQVSKIQLDTLGNLIDCKISPQCKDEALNERLAQDMKVALMNIRPWRVLYIRGEYLPDIQSGTFRYPF